MKPLLARRPLILIAASLLGGASMAQTVAFGEHVLPILEQHCVKCHRAPYRDERGRLRKPKAELRLDGAAWISKGSESGAVLVAGEPDQSLLYTLTALPEDDRDRMPAKGEPLTRAQSGTLRRWIEQGADFGGWQGAAGPAGDDAPKPAREPAVVQLWQRLARGLAPVPAAELAGAGALARITPVLPDGPLLRVEFTSRESEVDAAAVAALQPLRRHVTDLDLARTKVGDEALKSVADMERLTRLDLSRTAVGDRGLVHLRGLRELRSLNLFGTEVSDAGIAALAELPQLEAVYLWQSAVTKAGAEKLRAALPAARVVLRPELPAPAAEDSGGRRRRR